MATTAQMPPKGTSPRKTFLIVGILVILVLYAVASYLFFQKFPIASFTKNPLQSILQPIQQPSVITPVPTPTLLPVAKVDVVLPSGPQTYRFSHGKDVVGPKISTLTIDPFTPQPNQNQNVVISLIRGDVATKTSIEVITDNKKVMHDLAQKDGVWEGSWTIDDTYGTVYAMRLILEGAAGKYDEVMYFR